jgi:hypothetical protein
LRGYHIEWKKQLPGKEASARTIQTLPDRELDAPVVAAQLPEAVPYDSLVPLPEKEHIVRQPELTEQKEISAAHGVTTKTALPKSRTPLTKKHGVQQKHEAGAQNRGGFERFLLLLLLVIVLVPIILLVMVFSVVTFNVQSVLLGLLLLLLLVVVIVALVF